MRRLQNLSIPSIPSRFLTPVLKFDLQEKDVDQLNQKDLLNRLNTNSGMHSGSIREALESGNHSGLLNEHSTSGPVESVLVAKVARLTNDGSHLGPGQYNVDQSSKVLAASPRGAIRW